MQVSELPKITSKGMRRVGRGHGSGRVKTSGRGTKGQKARRTIKLSFEGGALPLIKRLPFRRGKGRNRAWRVKPITINVDALNILPAQTVIDVESLVKHQVVDKSALQVGVKILGNGNLEKAFTVKLPVTINAQTKIEQAGGKVENAQE